MKTKGQCTCAAQLAELERRVKVLELAAGAGAPTEPKNQVLGWRMCETCQSCITTDGEPKCDACKG